MAACSGKRVRVGPDSLARRPLRSGRYVAPTAYRKLLLEVAYKLQPWDVEELNFLVKDVVPPATAVEGVTALGLLVCLERHELLGPGNYASLRSYLEKVGREDLAALLAPPEDLQSAPASKLPSSASHSIVPFVTSRVATRSWPFSTFRNLCVEVFKELSRDEVEQIRWLSMDFCQTKAAEVTTGVNLLQAMEDSHLVGPGNYSFLVDCLQEIGRPDLVVRILPPALPYLPPTLNIPAMLKGKRMETLRLKKTQYQFGMHHLVALKHMASQNTAKSAGGWYKRILGSLAPKVVDEDSSYIIENLPTTLINMSLHLNSLLDGLQEYECNGDTPKFAELMAECKTYLDVLQNMMEEIDWDNLPRKRENLATSKQYHPVRQASYGAFSGLAELLLEFSCSRDRLQEETRRLSSILGRLEAILQLSGYMWSLTSWLIALLQVAVRSPVSLSKYDGLFRILVVRNRRIIHSNSHMLEAVLSKTPVGRTLLHLFRKKKLIGDTSPSYVGNPNVVLLHLSATPIPVFVFVLLLLSEHPSLAPDDLELIVESLKDHIKEREEVFCQINRTVTMMVLEGISKNVESFRQSRMEDLTSEGCVIEEIFSY